MFHSFQMKQSVDKEINDEFFLIHREFLALFLANG